MELLIRLLNFDCLFVDWAWLLNVLLFLLIGRIELRMTGAWK